MSSTKVASFLMEAAAKSERMRDAVQMLVNDGVLQRLDATKACQANAYQPNLVWAPSIFGSMLELDLREEVCASIFTYGVFDAPLLAFLSRRLRSGDVYMDVGAHIGFFTLAAASLVGEEGAVHAFEPAPDTFNRLTVNVRNSARSNVTIVKAAAWSEPGTITLNDFGGANSAFNSVAAIRRQNDEGEELQASSHVVDAIRLDDYVALHALHPNIIKIDVESAEFQVVAGLRKTLTGDRQPVMIIEVGDFAHLIAAGVEPSASLLNLIKTFGYDLFEIQIDGGLSPHQVKDEVYSYMNIVCVPTERCD